MKTWTADNPKAALMEEKRAAIVKAARRAFLESGYAETSMDKIADAAKVSIKTVYRHFENKDDLFFAVMQAACRTSVQADAGTGSNGDELPPWLMQPPSVGIQAAGEAYLKSVLEDDQIALFRVLTRDAHKFPELGRRYQGEVIRSRNRKFVRYLEQWKKKEHWRIRSPEHAANVFAALLLSELFEQVLLGL